MTEFSEAGRRGKDVRSDCWVRIVPRSSGGVRLTVMSRVEVMYGRAIRKLIRDELAFFGVEHALVEVEDSGALPFVLMARIEAAVKRLRPTERRSYLPEMPEYARAPTHRERLRRSRLYLPGNEPKFMINVGLHGPDGVILDLEDSVAPGSKDEALILVRNALRQVDFMGAERMVRINPLPRGLDEIRELASCNVHMFLIPKCESADTVRKVDSCLQEANNSHSMQADTGLPRNGQSPLLMPIVETCLGVFNALEIARASPRVAALTIGLEDYTADLGAQRTSDAWESFWARSQVVNAARAAGVQPIDTVFSDIQDMEGLRKSVLEAKQLGYEGKGCIHPSQIRVIHEGFAPDQTEIERACRVVLAFRQAQAKGLGVVSLGSKMIDPPVVKRALRTVELAVRTGRLASSWDVPEGQASSTRGDNGQEN